MKIPLINFVQSNNIQKMPRQSSLAPLPFDVVTFSDNAVFKGRRKNDFPYSDKQRDMEVALITGAINKGIENSELLDAEKISEITGLDIYVVRLRLSTNAGIKLLVDKMKAAHSLKSEQEEKIKAENLKKLLELIQTYKQKLTDNEMAFYLGLTKEELLNIVEKFDMADTYDNSLLKIRKCPLLEKQAQISSIKNAIRYITKKDTYDSLSKETELSPEIIRTRISEDDDCFKRATEAGLYPPDIYPFDMVEMQDDAILDSMLDMMKNDEPFDMKAISERTELLLGTVIIRFKYNTALQDIYKRMMGLDKDED